jgi:hypothetical protein
MTKQEYLDFHEEFCRKMIEVTKAKNSDYTGLGDNPFKNFEIVSAYGCVSVEQGFFTRMTDKMARISTFIQKGVLEVKDETVLDSLHDLANYAALFAGYIESKRRASEKPVQ